MRPRSCFLTLLTLFGLATRLSAQPQLDKVVVVGTAIRSGQGFAQVTVTLRNDSAKTITACAWSIKGTYPDASTQTREVTIDLIGNLTVPDQSIVFGPSSVHTFEDSLPLGPNGEQPVGAVVHLTMVAFDDGWAAGERLEIQRLSAGRRSHAKAIEEELDAIDRALKDRDSKEALRSFIADRRATRRSTGVSRQILSLLENGGSQQSIEAAKAVFGKYQQNLALHSALGEAQ